MLTQLLWWLGMALELALLLRAVKHDLLKAFPVFYTYVAYVLVESLVRFYVFVEFPAAYGLSYWVTQLGSVLLGYGVVWEICRQALARYSGTFRMARGAIVLIFVIVICKVVGSSLGSEGWSLAQTTAELERDFRTVQAFLILAIVGLLVHYRIEIGRNLRGMIWGYGFFIGTSILNLTFRSFLGETFQIWWQYLQPVAYVAVLLIWCATLWSSQPSPEAEAEPRIEQDYQSIVAATRRRFRQARAHVGRTVRP